MLNLKKKNNLALFFDLYPFIYIYGRQVIIFKKNLVVYGLKIFFTITNSLVCLVV